MNVSIKFTAKLTGAEQRVTGLLTGRDRELLLGAAGREMQSVVFDHLRLNNSHKTAFSLGATPTGHMSQAAEKIDPAQHPEALTVTPEAATLTIDHPGIGRAFHAVDIRPTGGRKYLTIPASALAYGRSAREFPGLVAVMSGNGGVLMFPQKGTSHTYKTRKYHGTGVADYTSGTRTGGAFGTVMFRLVKSVHQPQDRSILPGDEALAEAAARGASAEITRQAMALQKGGSL